ncbi:glycosyltransferase family 1 protein [Pseudomassariella vexata]|uniref:Glycosyltransferase family 1 protein n=1 Tax=Pseudomassariella vexata TaxID=1141098 RepID=A0A1Y2E1K3_9PEZI|nr:glycosyltransferase family 1 protein [Pseudomassariella vexata]ORY65433.1 glycosyltransferase family 1 protein [Pseudomassariella vexata]
MTASIKPLLVLTSTPGAGHVNPVKTLAKALILNGYEVTAVSSSHYQNAFEAVGCSYVAIQGYGDYWDEERDAKWPERALIPPGPEQFSWTMEHSFMRVIPDQFAAVQKAIRMLRAKYPDRPVILLNESGFLGSLPITRGARGVKPDGVIGIGVLLVSLNSVDTAPFGPGLQLPTSAAEVAQYAEMRKHIESVLWEKPLKVFKDILNELGAEIPDGYRLNSDVVYLWPDRFLQMCPPSTQYPRSDAPKTFRYTGGLPRLPKNTETGASGKPTWWNEVVDNPTKKDVVLVSQGTVELNYENLIIPTLEAIKDRPNTIVIVVLGMKGATLDSSVSIADNVRVVDYFPFDDILPYCSVFVHNGGYGGVQHSIKHGTPLVVAGETEDKLEMCAIAAEALRAAIDEVISDPKYKKACRRIQEEITSFDPIRVIAETIDELVTEA